MNLKIESRLTLEVYACIVITQIRRLFDECNQKMDELQILIDKIGEKGDK